MTVRRFERNADPRLTDGGLQGMMLITEKDYGPGQIKTCNTAQTQAQTRDEKKAPPQAQGARVAGAPEGD